MFNWLKRIYFMGLFVLLFQGLLFAGSENNNSHSEELKAIKSLHWIYGPKEVTLGGIAKFKVPEGYMFLEPADTAKLMEIYHNPPSYRDEYYFGPKNFKWFGLFSYEDTGHISDKEDIDADSLIENIKEGNEEANKYREEKGWEPIHITGWRYKPFYDKNTKRLSWAIDATSGGHLITNYNTRILGRTGVTSAILVVDPDKLEEVVYPFNEVVNGYEFNNDKKYSAFKDGDKVAKYGLAALIAGGAAAVATKKGLWATLAIAVKAFWKFILAGIIAFFSFFKNIFRRDD